MNRNLVHLCQYVRKTHTQRFRVNTQELKRVQAEKVGVFVAVKTSPETVKVGWSKCSKLDRFNTINGLDIACQRAMGMYQGTYEVPKQFSTNLEDFLARCKRYFKGATVELTEVKSCGVAHEW